MNRLSARSANPTVRTRPAEELDHHVARAAAREGRD